MAEQLFKLKNLREVPVDHDFPDDMTAPCRIINTNKLGQYFGNMFVGGVKWAIVLMSGRLIPEFIEADKIEILKMQWARCPDNFYRGSNFAQG